MADDRIEIEIVLDDGSIQKGFGKVRKEGKETAESLGSSFKSFGKTALASVAAIGAGFLSFRGLSSVISNLRQLDTAFAEIKTIIPDITKANDELRNSLIDASNQFGSTAAQQANAFYQIVSAGITDVTEANDLLIVANKLAIGGLTGVETAVDVLTSVVNAYGAEVLDATTASDVLFGTVKLGKTRVEDLASSIGLLAPTSAALGVSFQDVSGALAAITVKGVSTNLAVTQLNSVFTAVLKKQDEAAKLGPEVAAAFSLTALNTKGLTQFLGDLNGVLGGSEEKLTKLLGRAEGSKAIISLASDGFKTMANNVRNLGDSLGNTEAAAAEINNTIGQQLNILSSSVSNIFSNLGSESSQVFVDILKDINEFVSTVVKNIKIITETVLSLIKTFGILFVTLKLAPSIFASFSRGTKAMTTQLGLVSTRLALAKLSFQKFKKSVGGFSFKSFIKGLRSVNVAAKTTKIGLKLLKIGVKLLKSSLTFGLAFAIDFIIEKFIEIKDSVGGFGNLLKLTVLTARKAFNNLIITIIDFVSKSQKLPIIGSKIKSAFGGAFEAIKLSAQQSLKEIDKSFDDLATKLFNATTEVTIAAPQIAKKAVEAVKLTFTAAAPIIDAELNKTREKVAAQQAAIAEISRGTLFDLVASNQELFASTKQMSLAQLNILKGQLAEFRSTTVKMSVDVSNAIKNGLGRGISTGIQSAVTALQNGQDAISAFAKSFIGVMGDLAIQIGTQLLIAGLGLEQLFSFNPAGSILFGGALIALGTIMKSFAGGGGASANVPPSQSSVASPVLGGNGSITDGLNGPQQGVQVTINGDVFDTEDTGLRIADILKDQGFNNAVVS